MSDFIFKIQPNIVLGSYTTSRLGQYVKDWGSKFMVIVDPILKQVGNAEKVTKSLEDRSIDFFVFEEIPEGADTEVITNALSLARQAHIHGVIAVGGAKAINVGRAVATLYHENHEVYDFIDGSPTSTAPIPLIALPTTIRDHFLFTDRTPVVDARSSKIKLLKSPPGLCKLALFDPNLTVTLTENQTAAMAIETLAIATEAYLSQKATFFSDMIAEKAVELLGYAIDGSPTLTITTPQEVLYSQAGCMASLAAASSSIGAGSLISLCVNSRFKITKPLIASILFPYIIEDAAKFRSDRLARVSRILRAAPADSSDNDAVDALAEYVRQHIAKANLPARLKDLNVSIEQLSLSAEDGGELDLITTVQRSMTSDDLFDLIKQAF
ncbi:MAG: iron-containing alcohol dehydrogenase [Treponema sp.]|nr:iron-containing alcohol dehydrogenase [Treponema sp.]